MGKIRAEALIGLFERMAREGWRYEWGAAKEGCVDCSGAFVYAYKALGAGEIEHGSNAIARKRVGALRAMDEAQPGWACFKVRAWREAERSHRWYGTEPGNAYHIGLMGRDGRVYHARDAQSGFVATDTAGWTHAAPLLAVIALDDGDAMEAPAVGMAVVSTARDPLRIRSAPVDGEVIGHADRGAAVEVLEEGEWPRVRCGSVVGYACGAYLTALGDADGGEQAQEDGEAASTTIIREDGAMVVLGGRWRVAGE